MAESTFIDRKCDFCASDLSNKPHVDGKTRMGPWALMCVSCHRKHGVGFGTGRGQQFDAAGKKVKG